MTTMTIDIILATVAPGARVRAERLRCAITMLSCGTDKRDARRLMQERFSISYWTAWRIVEMAGDMADAS